MNPSKVSWQQVLQERISLFGHRNWVVVADSAYPAQSRDGIETIVANADHLCVLQEVLAAIVGSKHLRPLVYTDQEMDWVEEEDAPGISAYRHQLSGLLRQFTADVRPHEQIISTLDQAGQTFRVLIIKTNLTIPYTSVFLELDCSYWNADAECKLRTAMDRHLVRPG
jgi:L-fucose mutarotase/ribose pyranase (RbsD/FucU family)